MSLTGDSGQTPNNVENQFGATNLRGISRVSDEEEEEESVDSQAGSSSTSSQDDDNIDPTLKTARDTRKRTVKKKKKPSKMSILSGKLNKAWNGKTKSGKDLWISQNIEKFEPPGKQKKLDKMCSRRKKTAIEHAFEAISQERRSAHLFKCSTSSADDSSYEARHY